MHLIIQIALGIVLGVLILAYMQVLLSIGLLIIFGAILIGLGAYIIYIGPELWAGTKEFATLMPGIAYELGVIAASAVGILLLLIICFAMSCNVFVAVFKYEGYHSVVLKDLSEASKVGVNVFRKVAIRYLGERFVLGFMHLAIVFFVIAFASERLGWALSGISLAGLYIFIGWARRQYIKYSSEIGVVSKSD